VFNSLVLLIWENSKLQQK